MGVCVSIIETIRGKGRCQIVTKRENVSLPPGHLLGITRTLTEKNDLSCREMGIENRRNGTVALWSERGTLDLRVLGSNPATVKTIPL